MKTWRIGLGIIQKNNSHKQQLNNMNVDNKFKSLLVGRKITSVRRLNKEELDMFGWYKNPLVLVLDDNTQIVLQSDDEGNDGGAAFIYNEAKQIEEVIFTAR